MKIILKYSYIFLFALFVLHGGRSFSQKNRIDSLLKVVKGLGAEMSSSSLDDTVRIKALIDLSKEYVFNRDFSKSIKYASIAKLISEKLVTALDISISKTWLANSLQSIAFTFENQENFPNALAQYKKELVLREAIGEKHSISKCLNKIGEMYNSMDNLDASLEYYYKALSLIDEVNYKDDVLTIYNNIGIAYDRQKNHSKSLEYYVKVLNLSKATNDKNTMGICYSNIGTLYAEDGKNSQALDYFFKFLKIAEELGNKKNIAIAYLNISNVYDVEGNYTKAFVFFVFIGSCFR